jgi:hypothetical protein
LKDLESSLLEQVGSGGDVQNTAANNCGLLMELLKGDLLFQPSYSVV